MIRFSDLAALGVLLTLGSVSPSLAQSKTAQSKTAQLKPAQLKPAQLKTAASTDASPVVTPDNTPPPPGAAAPVGSVEVSSPGSPPPATAAPQAAGPIPPAPNPAAAETPAEPAVTARARQCLRANLERVVREEPSPKLATELLLADVCAEEVQAASLYARNLDALARFNPVSERGRAGLSTAHVDETTGQITAPPGVDVSAAADAAERSALQIAPSLRKFAAELVLREKARPAAAAAKKAR